MKLSYIHEPRRQKCKSKEHKGQESGPMEGIREDYMNLNILPEFEIQGDYGRIR